MRTCWGFIVFVLAAGGAALAAYTFMLLRQEQDAREALERRVAAFDPKFEAFKGAVRDVGREMKGVVYQEIALPGSGWQPIVGGFYVIDLDVMAAGSDVKIAGKIINPTTVTHEGAHFSIRIGEHKGEFLLPKVPPAVAQPFEVTVAGVAASAAQHAYLSLDSSTISFASSTTRKGAASGPLDTDKLLK
ncbi:MAG TPA: hypothetical protein VHL80_14170 [Polyangia bacterium]|nr:hypothetical protein [Polyangia bacterium]